MLLLGVFFALICSVQSDGYTCSQWRHTKDTTAYAQTCSVYGLPRSMPYWELLGTWSVWSDCRACGSPFHNITAGIDPKKYDIVRGPEAVQRNVDEEKGDNPETDMNPCCIFGEPPYFDGPDFLAEAINPNSGDQCEGTKYQFTLMGQWKTSHFYAPLSWCFWQTYIVTPNGK